MAQVRTDGASAQAVESGDTSAQWDSILSDGIASTGVDPTASFDDSPDPAEAAPQVTDPGSSDGASPSGRPSTPPAANPGDGGPDRSAAPAASVPPTSTPPSAQDQLPDATPFTYKGSDGQDKTIDGAMVLAGDGLYVPEAQIPHFQLLASTAETLERQNRELYDTQQTWERLATHTFRDTQGNEQTLTGRQGLEALRLESTSEHAALATLVNVIHDPARFMQLVDQVYVNDANQIVQAGDPSAVRIVPVLNGQAWKEITRESALAVREAQYDTRQKFAQAAVPPPPPEPSAADPTVAMQLVKSAISINRVTGLTAADEQFLAGIAKRYERPATPQEQQQLGVKKVLDESFHELVKDRGAVRAEAIKGAQTAAKADTFNQGMAAGVQRGKAPAPRATRPASPAVPAEKVGKQAVWGNILNDALADIA